MRKHISHPLNLKFGDSTGYCKGVFCIHPRPIQDSLRCQVFHWSLVGAPSRTSRHEYNRTMPYIQQGPQSCHRNCYFLLIFPHSNSPEVWKAAKGMPVTVSYCPHRYFQLFTFESIRHSMRFEKLIVLVLDTVISRFKAHTVHTNFLNGLTRRGKHCS